MQTCQWAARQLAHLPGLRDPVLSRWYTSAAVPDGSGPSYINGVISLAGNPDPAALLGALHALEAAADRRRSVPNAPRTLDLDIVDMAGTLRASPDPILPHPRAHLRAFVLLPLRDVAPDWTHPVSGQTLDSLIAALPAHDTHPL